MASTHRRRPGRTVKTIGALVAAGSASAATAPTPTGSTATGGFSPYVDTSLYPAYDLTAAMKADGVKQFNLAFVVSGGGCVPKWGGVGDLGGDPVAAQIGAVRAAGGDVRVSFGGANGTELAAACSSASDLAAAYGKVVDQYRLTKVDFDVEGGALPDTAANTRRAQSWADASCSSVAQSAGAFSRAFAGYGG